jgi:hypothetical protein
MKRTTMYKVMWVNNHGQGEMNQDGFSTREDADEYCADLSESFTDQEYYVTDYIQREFPSRTGGISQGVDGWEDMFNH